MGLTFKCMCVSILNVKKLYTLPPGLYHNGEMSGIKSETGDVGWRKAYGMDEGRKRTRGEILGGSDGNGGMGNATEPFSMSVCSRHPEGGALGEQDQSKCPMHWHVPSGSVLQ